MSQSPAFNTAASEFAAKLASMQEALGKNPESFEPVARVEDALARRFRYQGKDILERTSTAASFSDFATTLENVQTAITRVQDATPENAAAAISQYAADVTAELNKVMTNIGGNRAQIVYFRENNKEIGDDCVSFLATLAEMELRYGGGALAGNFAATKDNMTELQGNTQMQDYLLEGMQNACDEQMTKMEGIVSAVTGQSIRLQTAADSVVAGRILVDACVNGIKAPMTVRKKAVSFRPPQS